MQPAQLWKDLAYSASGRQHSRPAPGVFVGFLSRPHRPVAPAEIHARWFRFVADALTCTSRFVELTRPCLCMQGRRVDPAM